MDQIIETLATSLGDGVAWLAQSGVLFLVFLLLWTAFGVAVVRRHESIDETWHRIRALPLLLQLVLWVLLLPVMLGIWAWERTWPRVVRATVVLGLAGWNLLIFMPSGRPA